MKKYLFLIPILFILFCPRNVFAANFDKLYYFDSNFNILGQYTTTSSTANVNNVKYIRCAYTESFTANYNYQATFTYSVTGVGGWPYMVWNNAGININGSYVKRAPQSQTIITEEHQGANSYFRTLSYPWSWTQSSGGNFSMFVQLELQNSQRITYFSCDSFVISNSGSSSSGDTQQIINNQNSNTQNIINNNNINTNNIINSQNETTEAINDLNDTIQDTEIIGSSIGSKFGDIYLISDTPITDLLTMPLHLLQKIYNSIQTECTPYVLPFDFGFSSLQGYHISLPCLNLGHENRLGRIVWGYIDDLCCIFMIYNIFKMVIFYYDSWTSLKDNFDWLIDPSTRGLPY